MANVMMLPDPKIALMTAEEISGAALPKDQRAPGIYFLLDHSLIVYVGQTMFLDVRIYQHRMENKKKFTHYTVLPCNESELGVLESQYIARFRPRYNVMNRWDHLRERFIATPETTGCEKVVGGEME